MMQINGTSQTAFKDTEVGLIPVDWEVTLLEEVARTSSGGTPSRKKPEYFGGDIFWVKSGELNDTIIEFTEETITEIGLKSSSAKIFPKGTLLIALYGATVGKTGLLDIDATTNQAVCAVFPEECLTPNFMMYQFMARRDELLKERYGGAQPNISQQTVRSFRAIIPPLSEQRRIATVLNAIRDEIAIQDDILRELREFKRSTMERLFTYGAGDTPAETKMTEIGEFPVHWDDFLLNEVADLKYGYQTSIPKTPPQSGVDIISTAEIKNEGYLDLVKIRKVGADIADVAQYLVRKDDVLFNWRNSQEHVGKTALVTVDLLEPTIYASFIVRIRPTNHVSHQYIHYLLSFLRDRGVFFERSRRAVNQANFNANQLGNLEIPIPSSSEQETIVDLLQGIDEKIAIEEDRKSALQDFFRTMLQQLMTGQIRLLSDDGLEGLLDGKG